MVTAATSNKSGQTASGSADKDTDKKFNLDNVKVDDLPEEVRNIVKGFQSDYTKKTQAISEREKGVTGKEEDIERGKKWGEWYQRNEGTLAQYNEYAKGLSQDGNVHPDNKTDKNKGGDDGDGDGDDDLFSGDDDTKKIKKELKGDIGKIRSDLAQQKVDHDSVMQTGMDMMVSLMKVVQDNEFEFNVDPEKVIEFAKKEGITDMKRAVAGSYYGEIRDAEIKKGIEEGVKVEREKLNLQVVNNTMPQGRKTLKVLNREKK